MALPLILSQPNVVLQTAQMTCWAAAFNSWAQATGIRNPQSEAQLVHLFRDVNNALNGDNSATEAGIRTMNSLGRMSSQAVRGSRLTASFLESQLVNGHIYLAFRPLNNTTPAGHVIVVYGVEALLVRVMDPAAGISTLPLSFLLSRSHAVVGVPNELVRSRPSPSVQPAFGSMSNAPALGLPRPSRTGLPGYNF